jgi:L-threonylcarbamoyladenylate synthase
MPKLPSLNRKASGPNRPQARIFRGTPRNLARLATRLCAGDLVAVPTETVYGLAADATDAEACRRIFDAKGRPTTDPLIVHIADMKDLALVAKVNGAAVRLARAFWPGPLTIVLPKTALIPGEVTAGMPSVAVRMPAHPLFRRLIRLTGRPLAAPSANPFGYISPTSADHVRHGLGLKIRYILDGGPCDIGLESTIVDLRDPARPALLRPGAISGAELARVLGRPVASGKGRPGRRSANRSAGDSDATGSVAQPAPGMMVRHYSPHTPILLHRKLGLRRALRGDPDEAWLFLSRPGLPDSPRPNIAWLDDAGDLAGAGRRLYSVLRRLDRAGYRVIHAELAGRAPKENGIAEALNDRLRRASAKD